MSRRANGEGSIYKRKDGRWTARISLPGGRRKDFFGRTRQEVAAKLTVALKARDEGLPIGASEKLDLGAYLLHWLENRVKPSVRHSTYASYEANVRLHILPELGAIPLVRLTPERLQNYYAKKLASGLSATTVRYQHRVLHTALRAAQRWGLLVRNVTELVDPPRAQKREIATLDVVQARKFLGAVRNDRLYSLYVVSLCCGLRRGEVLALSWRDVDLERGTLAVRRSFSKVPGGWRLGEPKTAKSSRIVKLPTVAMEAFRERRAAQLLDQMQAGSLWHGKDLDLVFTTRVGTPLDGDNVRREFQEHLRVAGLPVISFHALRHSAATLMLALGVQPKVVAEMLGHSRISVTMDTYSHVLPHLQEEAATKMDALLAAGA